MTDRPRERARPGFAIDVGALMRNLLAAPNANLVTRPTGRAVREAIEAELEGAVRNTSVSVIDLTGVRILDFSCADEVVAGLLLRYLPADRPHDVFFVFRAIEEMHGHAVGEVLDRHGLAAVCDFGAGDLRLMGPATREERAAWSALERSGRIDGEDTRPPPGSGALLRRLSERRLAYRDAAGRVSSLSGFAGALARQRAENARDAGADGSAGLPENEIGSNNHGDDDGH